MPAGPFLFAIRKLAVSTFFSESSLQPCLAEHCFQNGIDAVVVCVDGHHDGG
jgi:hypothetical protein